MITDPLFFYTASTANRHSRADGNSSLNSTTFLNTRFLEFPIDSRHSSSLRRRGRHGS
ncbi:hypothetical protein NEIMUCOT_04929 [Neisseria mucosa ATCC 25996]|uniref:Uncharacterized protein n=1 Tax=Neisseria mucosa (strain ATCC 25996 / DSM 4631 / NCTC 10774 / M26) TaxID=546266 RepID=D2ZWD6_NEIM2|nr:hypothetical protein NEIMUCOT_04929 [Neisseria mucosa ATCC 25996]